MPHSILNALGLNNKDWSQTLTQTIVYFLISLQWAKSLMKKYMFAIKHSILPLVKVSEINQTSFLFHPKPMKKPLEVLNICVHAPVTHRNCLLKNCVRGIGHLSLVRF